MANSDPAALDPNLARELAAGAAGPFTVLVTFRAAPPPAELAALGLAGEGTEAFGEVSAAAIRTLAARPDVAAVVQVPAPLTGAAAPTPTHPKLGLRLVANLEDAPDEPHRVLVHFRRPPAPEDLAALGLAGGGDTEIVSGVLDRRRIFELAKREDVVLIDAMPELHLYSTP